MSKFGFTRSTGPDSTEQVWELGSGQLWLHGWAADVRAAMMCLYCGQPRFANREEQTEARGKCAVCRDEEDADREFQQAQREHIRLLNAWIRMPIGEMPALPQRRRRRPSELWLYSRAYVV